MSREASRECENILASARREAEALLTEARRKAAERRDASLRALDDELEGMAQRERERAQAEASRQRLLMEEALVESVFARAGSDLAALAASPGFASTLQALLAEAMSVVKGTVRVFTASAHVAACESWLKAHGYADTSVAVDSSLSDGVAVEDARRSFRVTNTLTSRLTKLENAARGRCLGVLFEAPGGGKAQS